MCERHYDMHDAPSTGRPRAGSCRSPRLLHTTWPLQDSSWLVQITSVLTLVLGLFKIVKSFNVKKIDAAKADGGESITDRRAVCG